MDKDTNPHDARGTRAGRLAGRSPARLALIGAACLVGGTCFAIAGGFGEAQPQREAAEPAARPGGGAPDFTEMLIAGLKDTEGCLGVDAAQFRSGKNTIVAWFENKEAAARWYRSPVHRRMLGAAGANPADGEPLEHVTDPNIPIMVMASISFGGKPTIEGGPIPFSQISIEVYTPLPGGASINGRLSPAEFKIPHHKSIGG